MQTFRGCLPAVSFTIRGYMNANLAGKRRADTSRTFRQLLFRTQSSCMVLANVKRTASSALPARHQGTSVFAVESVAGTVYQALSGTLRPKSGLRDSYVLALPGLSILLPSPTATL